jgi:hypothetical protein
VPGWVGGIAGDKYMIHTEELRIGNRVFWKPYFSNTEILIQVEIISVLPDKVGYIPSHLEHRAEPFEDDVVTKEMPYASFEELMPIPLTDTLLKTLDKKIKYPEWIQYLHELQNWYYWENEKRELELND